MTTAALYTVVVAVLNRADAVGGAVRSALEQAEVQTEVIVVDDGSTDTTVRVLRGIEDERLHVIPRDHAGRCASRNFGACQGSGDWLVFLDSDDILLPGALQRFEAARSDMSLVVAPTREVSADGVATIRPAFWHDGAPLPWGLQAGGFAMHRSLFVDLGGYCTALDHSEHTEMAMRLRRVRPAPEVARVHQATVEVRLRPGRYDPEVQYRSAVHLLDHVGVELAQDREARARQMSVAGEAARRLGKRSEAVRYLAGSFRANPEWRTAARLLRSLAGTDGAER